jgi:hypothetical protein
MVFQRGIQDNISLGRIPASKNQSGLRLIENIILHQIVGFFLNGRFAIK